MKQLTLIFAFMLSSMVAFSQETKLVSIPADQLTEQQKLALEAKNVENKINIVGKYAGVGKEIGDAVNGGLSALTHNVDTFSNTKAGKFTMFMIAYKIMGTDIVQFAIGVPFMAIVIIMSIVYYCQNIRNRKVAIKTYHTDGKIKEEKFEIIECDTDRIWGWIVMTGIMLIIGILIIFV